MTIKQQLIPLRIGKGLLSLVALFVMLLAPQRVWAQTDYGLTVAGVAVTSANASNVLSDQETPTVVFTPATGETAATLTLNGASFTGCVQWTNSDPLIVNFVGTSIITLESEGYAFVGNGGVLTFMTTSSTPLLVRNTFATTITNGWAQGSTEVAWDDESATWYLKQTQTSYELTLYKNAETYNLTVARVAVTEVNASDVLGDGKVSYDSKTNKLTLNGATIAPQGEAPGIDYTGTDDLTISFSGTNSITGASGCSAIRYNGTSQTQPTLTFESSSASSTLTLTETSSSVIRYFSSVLGVNGINDAKDNMLALTGGNVSYDAENGLYTGDDQNTVSVTSATITSGYGLAVGGVVVFADNASHILGDNNTTVTFNASNSILTLNGANFTGNIRWISANNLTVEILGNNIIDAAYSPFFQGNSNANLILTTNSDNPGDLHLTRCYSNNVMSGWKNNNSLYYNKETSSGAATDYGWWAAAISDQTKLRLNKVYDLWVDNVQLCDAQNEVSFDPEDYSGNRITYEDGKLKFQTVSKTTENSPFIVNGLGDLTILLVGNNTLNCGALFLGKKEGDSDHNVTFETSGDSSGHLVITTTGGENAWYTGHNAPTYEGLALVDEMKNNVRTLTISEPISYNLEVAGVSVTSANATNITGNYITGTVTFDAENNTLTLNNATIDLTEMKGPGISYTGTANLTISLIGTNSIKTQSGCEPIIYDVDPLPNTIPTLAFERESTPCSLELQTSGNDPVIRYFGNVLGVNGINEATGKVLALTNGDVRYDATNGLYTGDDQNTVPVTSATITSGYGLAVDGVLVHAGNALNVLSYQETPTVVFDESTNTLTLNGANLVKGSIDYCGTEDLTIAIAGNSKLFSINYVNDEVNDIPELTITKASGATDCSLALNSNEDGSVISGFSALNYGTFNTISSAPISYGKIDPAENYVGLFDAVTNVWMSDVTFTTATTYPLWVAGNQVTGVNADDLFDDGGNEQTPTVSFTPANTTTTPATPATLTLNGVNYSPEDGDVTPLVVSSLDNLTVKLAGSNSVYVSSQAEVFPEAAFVSTNSDAVLTFTTNESTNLQLLNTNTIELASGFSSIAFTGYLYRDQNMVKNLLAPTPSMDDNYLQIGRAGYEPDATTFNYVIEYEDESQSVNGTYDMSKTASENNIVLDKPCTVTVFAQYGTLKSAEKVGKLFGFKTSSVTVEKGKSIDIPEIVPAYNAEEIVFQMGDYDDEKINIEGGQITGLEAGNTTVYCNVNIEGTTAPYQILNVDGELPALSVTVLQKLGLRFYTSENNFIETGGSLPTIHYLDEYTFPVLKGDTGDGYTDDLSGFDITYSSSDPTTATIDATGKITVVGGGYTTIKAESKATDTFAADATWYEISVIPDNPRVSLEEGAYYTGQQLTLEREGLNGDVFYSYGSNGEKTAYTEAISLPKGCYRFYPYTRSGTGERYIWSEGDFYRMLYVFDQPTISMAAGTYEGDIEVEITNLPENASATVYYYFDNDEQNAKAYTAGDKILVNESKTLKVYIYVEGDSGKHHKSEVIEREYVITDITLNVANVTFHEGWATYYNDNGNVTLPEGQNVGAYVATGAQENSVTVTQIVSIPRSTPVLLNNATETTTTNVFGTDVKGNLLEHATSDKQVDPAEGDFYGLYNGVFIRVTDMFPAGKNYLLIPNAVNVNTGAPKLNIVFDNEANMTGIDEVRSKMDDGRGDIYDLQGRKVQQPSKKGLYINKGHKVVINK